MKKQFYSFLILVFLQSCKVSQDIKYLQGEINMQNALSHSTYKLIVQNNDILFVNLTTNNKEINEIFSAKSLGSSATVNYPSYENGLAFYSGYKVNEQGEIIFPMIGSVQVAGKSTSQIEKTIRDKFLDYANEVNVTVKLGNFKVTILGDLKSPKTINVPDEKMSIFELIGVAGDINLTADLKNVILLRESNGKVEKKVIDLTSSSLINSDNYFLKQNDIVYIPPKKNKFIINNYSQYFNSIIGGVSILLSITSIILR
jgi:polysaccharide export outer membrane protein